MGDTIGGAFAVYMSPVAGISSKSFDEIIRTNPDFFDQLDDEIGPDLGGGTFPKVVMPATVTRHQAWFLIGTASQILSYLDRQEKEHINIVDGRANISFRPPSTGDKGVKTAAGVGKGALAVVAHPLGVLAAGGLKAAFSPSSYNSAAVMDRWRNIERGKIEPAVVQVACDASNVFVGALSLIHI